jgi:hypothetical protein
VGGSLGPGAPLHGRGAYRGRQGLRKTHPLVPSRIVDNLTIYHRPRCPPSHPPRVAPPVAPTSDRAAFTRPRHRGRELVTDDDRGQDSAARPNRREPDESYAGTAGSATSATYQARTKSTTSSPSPREEPTTRPTSHRSTVDPVTSARRTRSDSEAELVREARPTTEEGVGYHRGRGRARGQRGLRAQPRTSFRLDSPTVEARSVGRKNRPQHPRPGRNRSRRSLAEERARAELDRDDPPPLPPRGRRAPRPSSSVVICPSGKAGFTEAEATRRLERYSAEEGNRRDRPRRVYPCPKCGAWHLTSRE